jgi:hypothetical protein
MLKLIHSNDLVKTLKRVLTKSRKVLSIKEAVALEITIIIMENSFINIKRIKMNNIGNQLSNRTKKIFLFLTKFLFEILINYFLHYL